MNHPYPTPEEIWQDYAGSETPQEFVSRLGGDSAAACVDRFLATLPHVYGIVRRSNWTESFAHPFQLRAQEVRHGLLAHLEAHEGEYTLNPFDLPPVPVYHEHHHIDEITAPEAVDFEESAAQYTPVADEDEGYPGE